MYKSFNISIFLRSFRYEDGKFKSNIKVQYCCFVRYFIKQLLGCILRFFRASIAIICRSMSFIFLISLEIKFTIPVTCSHIRCLSFLFFTHSAFFLYYISIFLLSILNFLSNRNNFVIQ